MMKLKPYFVLLLCFSLLSHASIPTQGTFLALKACPAYLSKNHKTNPDNVRLTLNQVYALVEANKPGEADWFRIDTGLKSNPLRWVGADCGEVNRSSDVPNDNCNLQPGFADSYILALSWQPAFCETYGFERGKAECYRLSKKSYTAAHLALHGFWPNQKACGASYGFCLVSKRKRHCDYPPVELTEVVAVELGKVMPSNSAGSCLERHEWNRHGSCQLRGQNDYFDTASKLSERFDQTSLGKLIRQYNGGYVSLAELEQAFENDFGPRASEKLYLGCQQGMLVDVWISLPRDVSLALSNQEMVQQAPKINRINSCPNTILISDFLPH